VLFLFWGPSGRKWRGFGEDCIIRIFINVRFTIYYYGVQTKEDEMGGTCSTHGRDEKYIQNFNMKT
jgi:hypothetical protein